MAIMTHQIGQALCDALQLPRNTVAFTLRARAGHFVTVECEYYPEGQAIELSATLAEYWLVPRVGAAQPHPAEAIDFDALMRQRADSAHAEFMRRTAALPATVDASCSKAAAVSKEFRSLNLGGASEFTLKRYRDLVNSLDVAPR